MSRREAVKPAEVAGEGADWLAADFTGNVPAEYARLFAKALVDEMHRLDIGYRELGKMAGGISHSTINGIIKGRTIPDLATIALLEKALNKELLPSQRLRKKR
ncbi:helix-turn-helix transcriptional regulator [Pseudarthrobacter sp. C4D7]|uniref:helix-turn-helix domain-containing protein n=1 Tax=Pseudarthrobacter sp. C4D7 TaxID=2735268 RepID=UPI001584E4B2|nr:helix-turn-helix transcriptional regulator [Pseudarthrobacter sp. C4D7]